MPTNINELEALRKKLDRDRRELEERERALAKVEQMLMEQQLASQPTELPISAPLPQTGGFTEAVRLAVSALGNNKRDFSVPEIEAYLQNHGIELPKVDPRSRISMALQAMRERDAIVLSHIGGGRQPHRYRLRK